MLRLTVEVRGRLVGFEQPEEEDTQERLVTAVAPGGGLTEPALDLLPARRGERVLLRSARPSPVCSIRPVARSRASSG